MKVGAKGAAFESHTRATPFDTLTPNRNQQSLYPPPLEITRNGI